MRLVVTMFLTLTFGILVAFAIALLIGSAFPAAKMPIFLILSICWLLIGWRYARQRDQGKSFQAAPELGMALRREGDDWFQTFKANTTDQTQALDMTDSGRHLISMLQLSAAASSIIENGYVSDPMFFLELVYIAMTGQPAAQMHNDIAEYQFVWPTQAPDDTRASLTTWARAMAAELSPNRHAASLESELTRYGALLVAQTKIVTCEHCGDPKGAEKVRAALR